MVWSLWWYFSVMSKILLYCLVWHQPISYFADRLNLHFIFHGWPCFRTQHNKEQNQSGKNHFCASQLHSLFFLTCKGHPGLHPLPSLVTQTVFCSEKCVCILIFKPADWLLLHFLLLYDRLLNPSMSSKMYKTHYLSF